MVMEIVALVVCAMVSILLPLVMLGIAVRKNREQWKGILVSFLCGGSIYIAMQWGVKEHGLTWLFNNTDFMSFMQNQYISYLLVVALAGSFLTIFGYLLVLLLLFRKQFTFGKTFAFGIGYGMTESVMLTGIRSINTLIEIAKKSDMELGTTINELFLSGYERLLLFIIDIAIVVTFVYFAKKNMLVIGGLVALFCQTFVAFLPGFFIAFTLPDYFEVFDRSIALVMVYVLLTAMAIASVVVIRYFQKGLETSVD